jgi:hypothetical protein
VAGVVDEAALRFHGVFEDGEHGLSGVPEPGDVVVAWAGAPRRTPVEPVATRAPSVR